MSSPNSDPFATVFGNARGGALERHAWRRINAVIGGCVPGGPWPYSWYALVDPKTLEHDDSFERLESAQFINLEMRSGRMLIVGMSGAVAERSLGRIDPHGHDIESGSG